MERFDSMGYMSSSSIQGEVARAFGVDVEDIMGRSRSQTIALARAMAMHLTRELTVFSYPEIGEAFDRNHTTVIMAVRRFRALLKKDDRLQQKVQAIEMRLKAKEVH
jgi:chromosomal replication initiator protein